MAETCHAIDGVLNEAWYGYLDSQGSGVEDLPIKAQMREETVSVKSCPSVSLQHGRHPGSGLVPAEGLHSRSIFTDLPPALILEVLKHLEVRDLCVVACVCSLLCRLSYDSQGWKDFYYERWGHPGAKELVGKLDEHPDKNWRNIYLAREARSKAFLGRFQMDTMHGHTAAVRCVRILAQANLVFTVGYDEILCIWNLEEGLLIVRSQSFHCTLRAVVADLDILAVAGTDAKLRVWHAISGLPHLFDVSGFSLENTAKVLGGHEGPISCLGLDGSHIYSGSWDMTVRVWDRSSLRCLKALMHADWVWSLILSNGQLFCTAGADLYAWHTETGELTCLRAKVHGGQAYAVVCSRSGQLVFTGGSDGAVCMFDEKTHSEEPAAFWKPHSGAVLALAYEDPWLVSASDDGSVALMDIRSIMKKHHKAGVSSTKGRHRVTHVVPKNAEPPRRMLSGFHQSFYSIDIGSDRVVGAGESNIIRVWDFSQALEIEQRVQASRRIRLEQRYQRKQTAVQDQKGKQAGACNVVKRGIRVGGPVWRQKGGKASA